MRTPANSAKPSYERLTSQDSEATSTITLDRPSAELHFGKSYRATKLNDEQGLALAQASFLSDQVVVGAVGTIRADNDARQA